MNNTAQPVPPKPAATIILLRDGNSGLEVLILRKASGQHFASGALVFPGGKVNAADAAFAGGGGGAPDGIGGNEPAEHVLLAGVWAHWGPRGNGPAVYILPSRVCIP